MVTWPDKLKINPNTEGNVMLAEWVVRMPDKAADEVLVEMVTHEMREKLHKKREKDGRGGWHTPQCTNYDLQNMLMEHVRKQDWVDVINLAGMILARTKLYGDTA